MLENFKNKLQSHPLIQKIFMIPELSVNRKILKSIRLKAQEFGAHALLEISAIADVDKYLNKYKWTLPLLITPLFIPMEDVDTIFIARAALWDVKTEYMFINTEIKIYKKNRKIPITNKLHGMIDQSKMESLKDLFKDIEKRIFNIK